MADSPADQAGETYSGKSPREPFLVSPSDLLRWAEALAGVARTGLGFTENLYERERFEEVLKVAADIRYHALEEVEAGVQIEEWISTVGKGVPGYVTPKTAVGAVVGNEAGEILLVQRAGTGVWLYPTGWADIGYSPSEVAVKEVEEETGIHVEPVALMAVFDGMRLGFHSMTGGALKPHPLECLDVGFFARDNLPEPLAGSGLWVDMAFEAIEGRQKKTFFDLPRDPTWRSSADDEP
jgi:ADP-ribose pyrophosphatase YjhB (NUDIX family)